MRTIETTLKVTPDGNVTVQLPLDIPAGEYQVVLVIDEMLVSEKPVSKKERPPLNFPVDSYGSWPPNFSLRREDMYD